MTLLANVALAAAPNGGTSSAINTTGATLLVVAVSAASGTVTVTDSKSNVWKSLTTYLAASTVRVTVFYCSNAITGTGHTFTTAGTSLSIAGFAAAFDGISRGVIPQIDTGTTTGTSAVYTGQGGSVTPTFNGSLILAVIGGGGATGSYSINSGFTITNQTAFVTSNNYAGALAYLIQKTPTTVNPTWTWTTNSSSSNPTAMVVFRPASAKFNKPRFYGFIPGLGGIIEVDAAQSSFMPGLGAIHQAVDYGYGYAPNAASQQIYSSYEADPLTNVGYRPELQPLPWTDGSKPPYDNFISSAKTVKLTYGSKLGQRLISGGRRDSAWYYNPGLNIARWYTAPNSTLSTSGVGWSGGSVGGSGTFTDIVSNYGGGVLNTFGIKIGTVFVRGTFMVIWGGGDTVYGGNEIYAYGPMEYDSPVWQRITSPTLPSTQNAPRSANTGAPTARRSKGMIFYDNIGNRMYSIGASKVYGSSGLSYTTCDVFDFNTLLWSQVAMPYSFNSDGAVGDIDRSTRKIWILGYPAGGISPFLCYDIAANTWTQYVKTGLTNIAANSNAAIEPRFSTYSDSIGRFVYFDTSCNLCILDIVTPSNAMFSPPQGTSNAAGEIDAYSGLFPTVPTGAVFCWSDDWNAMFILTTDGSVFRYSSPPDNTGYNHAYYLHNFFTTGPALPHPITTGTYGRFATEKSSGGLAICMPSATDPIYRLYVGHD